MNGQHQSQFQIITNQLVACHHHTLQVQFDRMNHEVQSLQRANGSLKEIIKKLRVELNELRSAAAVKRKSSSAGMPSTVLPATLPSTGCTEARIPPSQPQQLPTSPAPSIPHNKEAVAGDAETQMPHTPGPEMPAPTTRVYVTAPESQSADGYWKD